MNGPIYRQLAERLNTIPNGFPPTESGVELRLLEKLFTPEEARLASAMRLTREAAADIAPRAGMHPVQSERILKDMARKGLIRAGKGDTGLTFGLMPFVVGIYEAQLPHMDVELASLVEQYFQETYGELTRTPPALHRVIPVEEAIPVGLEIYPFQRASELIESARSWGVRDCICRVQRQLIGQGCEHPLEVCLVFAPVEGAFDHSQVDRPISKEEALEILRQSEEAGLVHTAGNYRDQHNYICNCCTCSCGILRGISEFGIPTAVARSEFHAAVDAELCSACEDCLPRCQFRALSISEDLVCNVDYAHCVGCGVCTTVCSTGALHLEPRPEEEIQPPPKDLQSWMMARARERHLAPGDVL